MAGIHEAMIQVMRSVGAIAKAQENSFHRYKFRGIDDVYQELHKKMAEAGIFCTSKIIESSFSAEERKGKVEATARLVISYQFWAADGTCVESEVASMGADNGDKAFNKALAAAHKYALLQAFLVPCAEMDDQDGEGFEYQTKGQPAALAGTAQYDPSNTAHKQALNDIFKQLKISDVETMRALSTKVAGVEMRSLRETIEGLGNKVPKGF